MNKTHSGYIGLIVLLVVCAIALILWTKQQSSEAKGQSQATQEKQSVQKADDLKVLIQQRNQTTMENL